MNRKPKNRLYYWVPCLASMKKPILKKRRKNKKNSKKDLLVLLLGAFCILAWFGFLLQIISALFFDKSSKLGFDEDYGIVVIPYNLYGEIFVEFIMFLFIFIISIYIWITLLKKY